MNCIKTPYVTVLSIVCQVCELADYSKTCSKVAGDTTSHNHPLPLTAVLSCVVQFGLGN